MINYKNGLMKLAFCNRTMDVNVFNLCKQLGDDEDIHESNMINTLVGHYIDFLCNTSLNEEEILENL